MVVFLAKKLTVPYLVTCEYVNARMSVDNLHELHLFIRGSRVPFKGDIIKQPQWDSGAGLNLLNID